MATTCIGMTRSQCVIYLQADVDIWLKGMSGHVTPEEWRAFFSSKAGGQWHYKTKIHTAHQITAMLPAESLG